MHDVATDTLNGWKEIAAFLGKSVRSAQRWEDDLGLPVHRIATPDGGQVIYASRREIEVWRRDLDARGPEARRLAEESDDRSGGTEGTSGASPDGDPATPPPSSVAVPLGEPPEPRLARWVRRLAGLAVLNATLLGTTAWLVWPARFAPARFELHGTVLRAVSASERVVWQHEFGGPVQHSPVVRGPQIIEADLDADGRAEVVAIVRVNASGTGLSQSDRIVAFRRDGRLLWTVQPTLELRDAQQTFAGPWLARALAVADGRVAAAFSHSAWRPNFVLEIDPTGRSRVRYVHGGFVQALAYWRTPRGQVLAIGGQNIEFDAASLALIDADGPGARPPAAPDRVLTCATCPTADVRDLYLFPTGDVTRALFRSSGWLARLRPQGEDLGIWFDAGLGEGAVAFLTPGGQIREYFMALRYWEAHRQFSEERRLDHSVEACPERTQPAVIRRWTAGTDWTELRVSPNLTRTTP